MGYSVHLFRKEVKDLENGSQDESFFESEDKMLPFSSEQKEGLKKRLASYDFQQTRTDGDEVFFLRTSEFRAEAILTNCGLYFSTGLSEDDIFEVSLIASEFTDEGDFAKYDPQSGEWEEI